jgi:hypothetical protein
MILKGVGRTTLKGPDGACVGIRGGGRIASADELCRRGGGREGAPAPRSGFVYLEGNAAAPETELEA